ncbi:hypothetical protein K438DRAFT_1752643 [Mycena galopus ATCC 62051]|nr:hypothetical protein K438DRAFT_1752643 [Mycena galopus ATCC 62051]
MSWTFTSKPILRTSWRRCKPTTPISVSSCSPAATRIFSSLNPEYKSPVPIFDPALPHLKFAASLLWSITQLRQATIAMIEGIGRGRTFEYVLSYIDGATAERIGRVDRAFPTSSALADYVETLAPTTEGRIIQSQEMFIALVNGPVTQALLAKFLVQTNNESIGPLELNYGAESFSL